MSSSCGCGVDLKQRFAAFDVEVNVSPWRPGLTAAPFADLTLRCPHGVRWHAEPTSEQRLRWAEERVP